MRGGGQQRDTDRERGDTRLERLGVDGDIEMADRVILYIHGDRCLGAGKG
jgi:hypothetical protein